MKPRKSREELSRAVIYMLRAEGRCDDEPFVIEFVDDPDDSANWMVVPANTGQGEGICWRR